MCCCCWLCWKSKQPELQLAMRLSRASPRTVKICSNASVRRSSCNSSQLDLSSSTELSENEVQPDLTFPAGRGGKPQGHGRSPGGCSSWSPARLGLRPRWGPHGQRTLNFSPSGLPVAGLLSVSGRKIHVWASWAPSVCPELLQAAPPCCHGLLAPPPSLPLPPSILSSS